jgi:hypothetical protein
LGRIEGALEALAAPAVLLKKLTTASLTDTY